jgi:hypothetical protein
LWKGDEEDPTNAEEIADDAHDPPVVRCPTCGGKGAVPQSSPTGHHRPAEC